MTPDAPHPVRPRSLNAALAATALVSAWLLFQVQPMVAKRILPWFGGGTNVWTTVMLFFQTVLFVGYFYAHLVDRWLPPQRQVRLHVALLATAAMLAIILGVLPSDQWKPQGSYRPALHILVMLAASVGLPFLILASTAPLVQVWFGRTNPGRSPYRLYALSNLGSLTALLSYPFLIEPYVGVARQGVAWSILFGGFALLCAWSGMQSLRRGQSTAPGLSSDEPVNDLTGNRRPWALQYFFWLALPACASVALLSITTHLCQDVASIPLLWIAPMVVYLLSFILTFDSDRWYRRRAWLPAAAIASYVATFTWQSREAWTLHWQLLINLSLLLAICMVCHGELARLRPPTARLTAFYLCISAGGAVGGLLTCVVAPLLLSDHYELQLSVVAAWLLTIGLLVTDSRSPFYDGGKGGVFAGLLGIVVLFIGLGTAMVSRIVRQQSSVVGVARNFYGVLKVREISAPSGDLYYDLANGRISHGAQFLDPVHRRVPMWYYHADSGLGRILLVTTPIPPRRIGVVGLGAGTIAAYADPGDVVRFYDVNPQVVEIAEEYFSYLKDAREREAEIEIVEGDGRLALESEPSQNFDVLVLDAFNGDAIPAHLMTLEAFELYLRHLKEPDGILAVHITNAYVDLSPVVKAAAEKYGLDAAYISTPRDDTPATAGSQWVLLHRRPGYFTERGIGAPLGEVLTGKPPVTWTDDYSNLLDVLSE